MSHLFHSGLISPYPLDFIRVWNTQGYLENPKNGVFGKGGGGEGDDGSKGLGS